MRIFDGFMGVSTCLQATILPAGILQESGQIRASINFPASWPVLRCGQAVQKLPVSLHCIKRGSRDDRMSTSSFCKPSTTSLRKIAAPNGRRARPGCETRAREFWGTFAPLHIAITLAPDLHRSAPTALEKGGSTDRVQSNGVLCTVRCRSCEPSRVPDRFAASRRRLSARPDARGERPHGGSGGHVERDRECQPADGRQPTDAGDRRPDAWRVWQLPERPSHASVHRHGRTQ